ncbi:PAS domain S-box protein [Halorubrum sp. Hd13]|uniref:PAS domain S-box protein n=1 Tax=Halorubrum sp. Hd13 TaxID=1480728 RepID=UPI00148210C4|nr:PAS domain S-box protein [Halorubrum sp. Hd13]
MGSLLTLSAKLSEAETVQTAVSRTIKLVETAFDRPVASVCAYDSATGTTTTLGSSLPSSVRLESAPGQIPESFVDRVGERGDDVSAADTPEATVDTDPPKPIQAEALVPVGSDRILRVGVTELDTLDEGEIAIIEGIAANLRTALSRIDHRQSSVMRCGVARALFDQSDDAMFVSDTDGTLVAVNRAAVELTGRDREALLTSALSDIAGDTAAKPVREHLEHAATGATKPLTVTLEHADDGDRTVTLTSQQVDVDGTGYIQTIAYDPSSDTRLQRGQSGDPVEEDLAALRRLNSLTIASDEFDETIERLLSLGRDHFGLDTGTLSHVDGDDYEVDTVVDATGTHEAGAVYDLGDTMCEATLESDTAEALAFANVAHTDYQDHTAAENVRAYIAAPVVVDDDIYGTVNFSMGEPRPEAFRPGEKEFIKLVAQWIGAELERRHRFEELERYETILEAVDDPVYALDTDGRFTFVNSAAQREFGYGTEIIGQSPTVGMRDADVEQVKEQIERLLATDRRSTTAEFVLETADGGQKTVENRLALIGDDEFRGTAGILRDITDRKERRQRLEQFQRAIEEAADGIAVLDGDEYTYVDQSHVDMYGFESKEQLLGNSWRELYDDDEIERLEREAFPALETEGYWRGMVTGSRPDGSTFPAELSLTIVEDGRLVCTVRDETERRRRERELELKERAMDEANVGIQITDPTKADNPLVYVNDGFERMTGYTREEAIGRNPRFLQGEDTDSEQVAQLRAAIDAEEPTSLELRNERRDGTAYWNRISITPVRDEDDVLQNYIGIQQDVTERKERERQLEARKDLLGEIYETTTDSELTFEEKLSELLEASRDYLDLPYGFLTRIETGDESVPGKQTIVEALGSHERLQPDESVPLAQSYCRKTIERDGPMAITNAVEAGWVDDPAYEAFELETYVGAEVVAGEDLFGTLCFASKEPRDRSFDEFELSFIRLIGRWVGYEIDRRNAREELRQQRERLELTLSGTNTGIAEWDLETDAVTWNETLVDIVGREITSMDEFRTAVHPEDRERVQRELEAMLETGDPWIREFRMLDGDGDTLWVGTRATPVYDGEKEPVRVLATGTDISDKKEAERERRRNEQRYVSLAQNIPNGAALTFDADLEYGLAAGELLSELGLEASSIEGKTAGTVLSGIDTKDELLSRFRAALDGERTDRRVELGDRTLRIHIVPVDDDTGGSDGPRGLVLAQDVTEEAQREQDLFEERERFRLLTESVDEYAFLIVDEEGVIQTWNEGAERTFGYDAEAAIGMEMAELHPEADRDSGLPERLLQQARIAGESAHEGWRVRADGSEFYADVRYAPLEDDDGEFRGYAKIVHDLTDKRRERRRTERFVEESDDVVTIVDPDGTVTYASRSATRVLGHDPDDLVGENLFDYLHPDSREGAMETFFSGLDEPNGSFQAEWRFKSGDNEWLNVEGQCRNMLDDDAIGGMLLYLRNVTDQKKRARRFESIFNQTFQFTGLLEPDGTVVEVNNATLEFGGVKGDAIVGEPFSNAPWWTHSEDVRDDLRNALERGADGELVRYETEIRGADGLATIDFSVKPVTDDDGEVSLLVVEGGDITARIRNRRHLEVMQRVMRHNMRNDLTKVRGWTEVMAEEADPEKRAEQFETVERILDKWESMTEKMKQMRQVIRSQKGQRTTAEAGSLVEHAVAPIREEYPDTTVVTDISGNESREVPRTLQRAVHELVENAAKVNNGSTVEVELTRPESDWIEISVRDDGPGMPEMEADLLETGEETPLNHGQGLGLWMVRMIVTGAGGDASVETTDDGTEVCLRVPASRTVGSELSVETPR